MNKIDIINQINKLTSELPLVKKIAEISDHEGLELAYNNLMEECCALIKAKEYKESKKVTKSLEVINSFQNYLAEQKARADRIEYTIAQLRIELTRCQLSLFEENNTAKIATGFEIEDRELFTGDCFETSDHEFLLIVESEASPSMYAITGTAFDEELLLQYPKNRSILKDTAYLGNMFDNADLAEFLAKLQEKESEIEELKGKDLPSEDSDDIEES